MAETKYEIFQKDQSYRVRITHPGCLAQEAAGFASRADAVSWIAHEQHMAARTEQKDPATSAHLRAI